MRIIAAAEIADNPILVARLKTLYDQLDAATTPMSVLVPWFPSLSSVRKLFATKEIYDIISRSITARRQSAVATDDTLQMLLDNKDDDMTIIGVTNLVALSFELFVADAASFYSSPWVYSSQAQDLLERQVSGVFFSEGGGAE